MIEYKKIIGKRNKIKFFIWIFYIFNTEDSKIKIYNIQ